MFQRNHGVDQTNGKNQSQVSSKFIQYLWRKLKNAGKGKKGRWEILAEFYRHFKNRLKR
jgi:hypothetical protein